MLANWDQRFPGCEPVGHFLRRAFPDRWVRFHSLPESKRYPELPIEYEELLERHNGVMGTLSHSGESVVLLTTGYAFQSEPISRYRELSDLIPDSVPWRKIAMHEIDEWFTEPTYWHVDASSRIWHSGAFDPIVRLVANDTIANVLIVAEDCRWVLHPYDGGMDLIAETMAHRDEFRSRFSGWLSKRPDGM